MRERSEWNSLQALPGMDAPFTDFKTQVDANQKIYVEERFDLAKRYGRALMKVKGELEARNVTAAAEAVGAEIQRLTKKDYSGYPTGTQLPDVVVAARQAFEGGSNQLIGFLDQADMKALLTYDDALAQREGTLRQDGKSEEVRSLVAHRFALIPSTPAQPIAAVTPSASAAGGDPGPSETAKPPVYIEGQENETVSAIQQPSARDRFAHLMTNSMSSAEMQQHAAVLGAKPPVEANGSCPIAVAGMSMVSEITPSKVKTWGPLTAQIVQGEPFWTVSVFYDVQTLFGTIQTEGTALMQNGQVIRWIYAGSLEPIN